MARGAKNKQNLESQIPTAEELAHRIELRRQQQYEEMREGLQVLFPLLQARGVVRVVVSYDGEGDSGHLELPYVEPESATLDQHTLELVERAAYDVLEVHYSGWEINEGSYGDIVFEIPEGQVRVVNNERYVEVRTDETSFPVASLASREGNEDEKSRG